jgi:hypothetical protein
MVHEDRRSRRPIARGAEVFTIECHNRAIPVPTMSLCGKCLSLLNKQINRKICPLYR